MEVNDHERISRFLLFSRWFSREHRRVKPDAFIPHPRIELSVSCTDALSEEDIWPLGQLVIEQRADKVKLYGRGDLIARDVRTQKLEIKRDDKPPRHANIIGWPNESRSAQRMMAIELAAASKLVIHEI